MVAQRQPPKLVRSPPPSSSSSSSPAPPSTSAAPPPPMSNLRRIRREGTAATNITTGINNAPSVNSAAAPAPRPGPGRTIPTTTGVRPPLRRRPSPSPPPNAPAATLEASNQAPAAPAGEPPSRSVITLRREGLGVPQPPPQQPQAAGAPVSRWKRRRPDGAAPTAAAAAPAASVVASRGPQEAPEAKRQQVERVEKPEPVTGGAAPKSAPQASVTASVEASAPAPAVEEKRSDNSASAPVADEGKAPVPPPSTGPSPVPRQLDRVSDLSDLATRSDPVADLQVSKAAVASALAVSDVGGKPATVEDPMDVVPVTEDGSNSNSGVGEQLTDTDNDDAHDSSFAALIKKHAEMIRRSSLWISGSLQSIRDDISKAAASDAGRAKLGEILRMSITDFFEPAAERTKVIGVATDTFVEEVERYCKSDKEVAA